MPYFLGTLALSANANLLLCHDWFVSSALSFSLDCHGHCDGDEVILAINLPLLCQRLLLWAVSDLQMQTMAGFGPFPCSSLVVGVLLAEQQSIIWFSYEDTWQGCQFNSVLGVSENKTVLSRISYTMFSVCCLVNSDKTWRAGNLEYMYQEFENHWEVIALKCDCWDVSVCSE